MFDHSVFFEKIGPNQYLYRNNRLRSSKAYLLTYKEKKAIEKAADQSMKALFALIGSCSTAMYFRPKIGCFAFGVGSISLLLKLKADMKKIIGDRKKIPCHKEPLFSIYERQAQTVSWKNILHLIFGEILFLWGAFLSFKESISNHKIGLFIWACVLLTACLLAGYIIFLLIRHKPKKDQNT